MCVCGGGGGGSKENSCTERLPGIPPVYSNHHGTNKEPSNIAQDITRMNIWHHVIFSYVERPSIIFGQANWSMQNTE